MRRYINHSDQTRLAHDLNSAFAEASDEGTFATAIVATYLADHRALIVCNAGHPRPMVFRRETGRWGLIGDEAVERSSAVGVADLPLGVLEPTTYTQLALGLDTDDLVLFYTDSLVESRDVGSGRMLGEPGLLEVLNDLGGDEPTTLVQSLVEAICERAGGRPFDDDVTAMLLHHTENALPPQSWGDRARTLARLVGLLPT
jgi:serine phosphatase RsbU (regulator of sigma subunit)